MRHDRIAGATVRQTFRCWLQVERPGVMSRRMSHRRSLITLDRPTPTRSTGTVSNRRGHSLVQSAEYPRNLAPTFEQDPEPTRPLPLTPMLFGSIMLFVISASPKISQSRDGNCGAHWLWAEIGETRCTSVAWTFGFGVRRCDAATPQWPLQQRPRGIVSICARAIWSGLSVQSVGASAHWRRGMPRCTCAREAMSTDAPPPHSLGTAALKRSGIVAESQVPQSSPAGLASLRRSHYQSRSSRSRHQRRLSTM
jgi:hypothetical protein